MVRMAGWTLQLIVLYLDYNFEIGQGPNKQRTEQALQCIMAAKVPWLVIGISTEPHKRLPTVLGASSFVVLC